MKQQTWRHYVERLKQNPADAEALAGLEALLEKPRATHVPQAPVVGVAKTGAYVFMGGALYKKSVIAWDAWSAYMAGVYEPKRPMMRSWPEVETRDALAALAARFVRIGMITVLLTLMPSMLMIVQVYQIQQQNAIITEQNALTREQFGVSYRTQLVGQLYEQSKCAAEERRADYGQVPGSKAKRRYCPPAQMLRVRQEAARALVQLYKLQGAGAQLERVDLDDAEFRDAPFARVNMSHSSLQRANLRGANFDQGVLDGTLLEGAQAQGASFNGASMIGVDLTNARLKGATLQGATLRRASLKGLDLQGADLSGAVFYKADKPVRDDYGEHVKWSGIYRLKDANLTGANLIRSIFQDVRLEGVDFSGAKLVQASFIKAQIKGGSFKKADLRNANFSGATLTGTDMEGATLKGATLAGATFVDVTCPDGTNSDKAGKSCKGHEQP